MSQKHVGLIVLCCLIPVGAAGALLLLHLPLNAVLIAVMLLLCPGLHLLLMRGMRHAGDHK